MLRGEETMIWIYNDAYAYMIYVLAASAIALEASWWREVTSGANFLSKTLFFSEKDACVMRLQFLENDDVYILRSPLRLFED